MKPLLTLFYISMIWVASASSVLWNCFELPQPYATSHGLTYNLQLHDPEWTILTDYGFDPMLIIDLTGSGSAFSVSTRNLENTAAGFIGNWLVVSKGQVVSAETARMQGTYLNHSKIDDEVGFTTYNLSGSAPCDYYLAFVVESVDDYANGTSDPRYAYGWAHVGVNEDLTLSLIGSAIDLDGNPIAVGAIPEPSCGLLLLVGIAALSLRRKRVVEVSGVVH